MPKEDGGGARRAGAASEGTTSARVATVLDRAERANPQLRAFKAIPRERALAEARVADEATAAGAGNGVLHGLPVVVKDIIDVGGMVTECGSLTRDQAAPAQRDAHVVARLKAAGAVVVAKTHTVEFAFGGYGTNVTVGTPWNPWDLGVHRIPGGSSSGTGVAVSAGIVPGGLGTDTGGSVRIPAALCGCVGLKTSFGLVGRSGIAPLSQSLDTAGPLACDVTTAARMLAAMQGHDPDDPATDGVRAIDPLADLERGVEGLRLGCVADADLALATPEVLADLAKAVTILRAAGARIEPIQLPHSLERMSLANGTITAVEGYANWRALVDDPKSRLADPIRARMLTGKTVSAADFIDVMAARKVAQAAFAKAFDRLDAVLLPTMPFPAIPVAEVDEAKAPMGLFSRWVNYLELAALTVPTSLGSQGLPLGLQIVVRRFDDPLALRIGWAFERARGGFPKPRIDA